MFSEELAGLPPEIQEKLRQRIEEIVRLIYRQTNNAGKDPDIRHYTKEEIAGMFHGIFDLAQRLQPEPEIED